MNGERKTTRKNFLKWSGLALAGGLLLAGKHIFDQKAECAESRVKSSESQAGAPQIRPAQGSIARENV